MQWVSVSGVMVLLLAGCVALEPVPDLVPGSCAALGSGGDERPDLFVQNATGIHLLRDDSGRYERVAQYDRFDEPYGITVAPDGAFAVWSNHLVRFDAELDVVKARSGTFGGIDLVDDTLWVAHRGALAGYDTGLRPLQVVDFSAGTDKVSHDVLVCGDRALLLDNVVSPVYVYQVDLGDGRGRVLDEDKIECLCHLAAQWVDAEQGAWYVLESGGGRSMTYQAVQRFPLGGGDAERTTTFTGRFDSNGRISDGGHQWYVLAVAPTEPPVALAWHMDRHWLGRLDVQPDGLWLDAPVDLDVVEGRPSWSGDLDVRAGVAALVIGDALRLVDMSGTPRLLHAQTLDEPASHVAIGS